MHTDLSTDSDVCAAWPGGTECCMSDERTRAESDQPSNDDERAGEPTHRSGRSPSDRDRGPRSEGAETESPGATIDDPTPAEPNEPG